MVTTAARGAAGNAAALGRGAYRSSATLATTGRITTWIVLISRPGAGTAMRLPEGGSVNARVVPAASRVETAVIRH